ncbi:saccharopine dehydrogenase NADP-binding domain-containing protein [Candidatus Woesearchaeota archaeon]|nr:saccharopine dehydrogenase NADP-binding domain-containing protein [Candidatus Woesearchaeota archaeon]
MKRIIILGGYGNIGKVVAKDLFSSCKHCEIVIAGSDKKKAEEYASSFNNKRVKGLGVNVKDINKTAEILKGSDVVINCVIYYLNLHIMKACLKAKANYLDLGGLFHMTKKQLKLHKEFKRNNLIAVLGCGSTPGITNIMAAYGSKFFDKLEEIHISFGDKDFTKYNQPFVLPYTMYTLFDEFMLKPAVLTKRKLKFLKPVTGEKEIEFPKPVGKLKGFLTLHSELATFPSSFNLKECTFRVTFNEDFKNKIQFLIKAGFASEKDIKINNIKIKPKDFTARIMNQWLPKTKKINDLEYLKLELKGIKNRKSKNLILYCLTKSKNNIPAGVYNTATPPSIIAQMIYSNKINIKGVLPSEKCINPENFFKELNKRDIIVFKGKK